MLEFLISLDTQLFLFLNNLNNSFFDIIFFWISYKYTWIPFYIALIYFFIKKKHFKGLITIALLVIVIVLCDQISVHLFKEVFQRLRPCHNPNLNDLVHIVNGKCGGKYGFVSSHAANSFGLAIFTLLYFKNRTYSYLVILWALITAYSRVYLGVHFPLDVICGGILGGFIAWGVFCIYKLLQKKIFN